MVYDGCYTTFPAAATVAIDDLAAAFDPAPARNCVASGINEDNLL
jgi:hypothetical protein